MAKSKILLTRRLHDFALRQMRQKYRLHVHSGSIPMPKKLLKSAIKDAVGLVCFPYDRIDADVIDAAKDLKVISTYSVGYDHIDLQAAKKRRIKVGYTPDVLTDATADLTVALVLDVLRRLSEGDRLIRAGKWGVIFGADDYVGVDMNEKTLGILGMGRIGMAVARRVRPFGMKVIYHSRTRLGVKMEQKIGLRYASFYQVIRKSDVLSIHVPYSKQTHQMINKDVLRRMKRTAFLVNTSRGKVIKESDLVWALRSGRIAGAALDVFESEPISNMHPLAKMENVVLAPHIGSSTAETRKKMAEIAVQNLLLGLCGKKMVYSVDVQSS
jgi:glyoxylate reductase